MNKKAQGYHVRFPIGNAVCCRAPYRGSILFDVESLPSPTSSSKQELRKCHVYLEPGRTGTATSAPMLAAHPNTIQYNSPWGKGGNETGELARQSPPSLIQSKSTVQYPGSDTWEGKSGQSNRQRVLEQQCSASYCTVLYCTSEHCAALQNRHTPSKGTKRTRKAPTLPT
jgi:hypothetical protein